MKWYKESYFDRGNWILENFDKLNLTSDETILILLADLCKSNKKAITYDYLKEKLHKKEKDIDKIIASLVSKNYLKLTYNSRGLVFDIDNIFEFDPSKYEIAENKDLYDIVSDLFGKPLSPTELQKMSDLIDKYSEKKFIEALRKAEAKKILTMNYIAGILNKNNEEK